MKTLFSENGRFLTKHRHEGSAFFLENERFLTKYGHKSSDFLVKNWKKERILLTFLSHNIELFYRIDVFSQNMSIKAGGFQEKYKEMT